MRTAVGVTDNMWAEFLCARPWITEANFWLPSPSGRFRALSTGEPFLFKTHWPQNQLVGGGFFGGFAELTIAEAWEIHGESNGVASLHELANRIASYRKTAPDPKLRIGCVLLRDLFFTEPSDRQPAPVDFAKNIVRYKGYDLATHSELERTFRDLLDRSDVVERAGLAGADSLDVTGLDDSDLRGPLSVPGPTRGLPRLTVPRVGQDAFKSLILTSYHRRCAVTGNKVEPVLQAAHIRPIAHEGAHRVDNGLLLRSDVHILFDRGYLGIDEKHQLRVSSRLREDYGNGDEFYSRAGDQISVPAARVDRPAKDAVAWHMDTVFLG